MARRSNLIVLDLFNLTTSKFYGNSTTGGIKFPVKTKIESIDLVFHAAGTTTNTKQLGFHLGKNATTATINLLYGSATKPFGATTGWKRKSASPSSAALSEYATTDRFWCQITNITAGITRLAVVLKVKQ